LVAKVLPVASQTYEERYLAFVDVLGFSNLVERSRNDVAVVLQLDSALSDISARARAARSDELRLEATSFSDTVVISAPVGEAELLHMLQIVDEFGFGLLRRNMLFRGAVVRGQILHRPDLIFGPALIDAYKLESETSFHPRIMFDASVYGAMLTASMPISDQLRRYLTVDAYDVPYLNIFARWQTESPLDDIALAELIQLQDIIAAGLVAGSQNPSVGEKYKWLGRKLNRFISERQLSDRVAVIDVE
jgi:hypothetical protein